MAHSLNKRKFEKLNYLKYKPTNEKILQPNQTEAQQGNSKLSYANSLKQNVNHKPPANNTRDRTCDRPALQQQLKSFSTKHTERNRSRSPSRQQSTTDNQARERKTAKLKAEIENLKQINSSAISFIEDIMRNLWNYVERSKN